VSAFHDRNHCLGRGSWAAIGEIIAIIVQDVDSWVAAFAAAARGSTLTFNVVVELVAPSITITAEYDAEGKKSKLTT